MLLQIIKVITAKVKFSRILKANDPTIQAEHDHAHAGLSKFTLKDYVEVSHFTAEDSMMEGTGMVTHCKQQRLAWFQNYLTPKRKQNDLRDVDGNK